MRVKSTDPTRTAVSNGTRVLDLQLDDLRNASRRVSVLR
jgi:hypothetical protein